MQKKKRDQVPPRVPLTLGSCHAVLYRVPDELGKKRFGSLLNKRIATLRVLVPKHMQHVPSAPQQPLSASAENMD